MPLRVDPQPEPRNPRTRLRLALWILLLAMPLLLPAWSWFQPVVIAFGEHGLYFGRQHLGDPDLPFEISVFRREAPGDPARWSGRRIPLDRQGRDDYVWAMWW